MDISARAVLLPDRPRMGHLGHQCSHAPVRPILHLVSSSRRLGLSSTKIYHNLIARKRRSEREGGLGGFCGFVLTPTLRFVTDNFSRTIKSKPTLTRQTPLLY